MKGNNHEIPLPLCLAATVVGPAREGIQKKPSVKSPLELETTIQQTNNVSENNLETINKY